MRHFNFLFVLYFAFCLLFLSFVGVEAIKETVDFQFYADTNTYVRLYNAGYTINEVAQVNLNLVGPLLILKSVFGNFYLVLFINLLVLYQTIRNLSKAYNLNQAKLFMMLIIAPLMLGSIIGINKEIFSLWSISFILLYMEKSKIKYFIYAMIISVFVRWQLSLVILIAFVSVSRLNPYKNYRLKTILLLLIGISIFYPLNLKSFEHVDNVAMLGAETTSEGSGLFTTLILIQNQFLGYLIVFVPKAFYLLGGLIFRIGKIFDFKNLYNNFFVTLQCVFNLLLLYKVFKKRPRVNDSLVFIGIVYLIIFSITPIFAPRYLFPVYFLMCIYLSKRKSYDS
ncbi:hypothetical protein MODO_2512 [Myroides odoratimimus]|uniref:hypothetical protein n=1 Tax=Myroides odoratimimus TaxID=76832 RepID=UPI000726CDBC|nr:hypothetical protein [Myroides odoratimimus]GAQ14820.1 hypothetical protein MODO_2512 [Myroides odoratimimus]STZ48877.1 Uncharacterised protein [Myroides odoratimimus]